MHEAIDTSFLEYLDDNRKLHSPLPHRLGGCATGMPRERCSATSVERNAQHLMVEHIDGQVLPEVLVNLLRLEALRRPHHLILTQQGGDKFTLVPGDGSSRACGHRIARRH